MSLAIPDPTALAWPAFRHERIRAMTIPKLLRITVEVGDLDAMPELARAHSGTTR